MASTERRARRTDPDIRRRQLIESALPAFAGRGYDTVELKEVAAGVGVTPNLIHHYFPGGKQELYLEAVGLACDEIVAILETDPSLPTQVKTPINVSAYLDEALVPTPRYELFMRSLHSADAAVAATANEARGRLIGGIALNHFGTREPPDQVRAALAGLIGFVEAAAEVWRVAELPDRAQLEQLIIVATTSTLATLGAGAPEAARA